MNKIFFLTLILISAFTLSACTAKDKLKAEILNKVVEVQNKVNNKINQKVTDEKSEQTDEQLLKDLGTDDTSIDADLKALETDLQ